MLAPTLDERFVIVPRMALRDVDELRTIVRAHEDGPS
jgi:hypothetical protein